MKFKVGDLIAQRPLGAHVEAIILEHWQTETNSPLRIAKGGIIDSVRLFITFHEDYPSAVGEIEVVRSFQEKYWGLKNEV